MSDFRILTGNYADVAILLPEVILLLVNYFGRTADCNCNIDSQSLVLTLHIQISIWCVEISHWVKVVKHMYAYLGWSFVCFLAGFAYANTISDIYIIYVLCTQY